MFNYFTFKKQIPYNLGEQQACCKNVGLNPKTGWPKKILIIVIACLFSFFKGTVAEAASYYVPDDFTTIQEAINATSSLDEIVVRPGTYTENINFNGKAITIRSEIGAEVTIIDGGGIDSVVTFDSGEGADSQLTGFTITNGNTTDGGGIYSYIASPTITDCIISGNTASQLGGGVYLFLSPIIMNNCIIDSNTTSSNGGGLYLSGSSATISNCTFSNNTATVRGGGISSIGGSPIITKCTFSDNNSSVSEGGGLYTTSTGTVSNCSFNKNTAGGPGGGIASRYSAPTVSDCTFTNNTASDGGGLYYINISTQPIITRCTISNNISTARGGGLYTYQASPKISNCLITSNTADWDGGGIDMYNSSPLITNCTFADNSAANNGGSLHCNLSSATITNSILWGGSAAGAANEVYFSDSTIDTNYSDIQGGVTGTGNIDVDPMFVGGGNYHLTSGSPCLDKGTDDMVTYPSLPANDIDGESRPQGATYDIGADEYFCADLALPVSSITSPADGSRIVGQSFTIAGSATDNGCAGVDFVEVSTDSGFSWSLAQGTSSWSYTWPITPGSPYTILSRATDNLGNVEIPGVGITVEVDYDSDGVTDDWEILNGLDPEDSSDAEMDFDNDGLTNLDEFSIATDPHDLDSDDDGVDDGHDGFPLDEQRSVCPAIIQNYDTSTTYYSLYEAFHDPAMTDNDTIKITASDHAEDLIFDQPVVFTLSGGYYCDFLSNPVNTTIFGSLTINNGTVTMENIILR